MQQLEIPVAALIALSAQLSVVKPIKPTFHWKWGSRWLPNANEIYTQKNEMYMANARNLRLGLNATYIPLTRVGGFALGDAKNLRHPTQKIPTCWYICVR